MSIFFWVSIGLGAFVFWVFFTGERQSPESLAAALEKASSAITPELFGELQTILARGRKLEAIRRLRQETGCGLYVAKQIVDQVADVSRT